MLFKKLQITFAEKRNFLIFDKNLERFITLKNT